MNNKIDLLVSFDTTGSMYPVLAQVRREVEKFVQTMFKEFTDLRLGIIAHGDYCDKDDPYTIIAMDLTRDEDKLCRFVHDTKQTYGGDADECYELVLNTAHKVMNWREDAEKVMLMIGDASPHRPNYPMNKDNLDWKEEAEKLADLGVKVFSVHALAHYRTSSKEFYKHVSEVTGGVYLTLDMFNEVVDLIKATCYQQGGEEKLNEFVTIIKDEGKLTKSMNNNIRRLRGEEVEDTYERSTRSSYSYKRTSECTSDTEVSIKEMDELVPVLPGRFQIMTVDENCDIKGFVTKNGIKFQKGRGFYELSKAETVQQYKEVIMMDRETGEMFNGSQVRKELGLQPQSEKGGAKERLHKSAAEKFRVFVQSTSVNRKLIAGTTFLYEVDDLADAGTIIEKEEVKTSKKVKSTKKKVEAPKVDVDKLIKDIDDKLEKIEEYEKKDKTSKKAKKTVEKTAVAKKVKFSDAAKIELSKASAETKAEVDKTVKPIEKVEKQIEKVTDGLGRFKTSKNKKNTTFLKNNLNKLIEEAEKLLKEIGE